MCGSHDRRTREEGESPAEVQEIVPPLTKIERGMASVEPSRASRSVEEDAGGASDPSHTRVIGLELSVVTFPPSKCTVKVALHNFDTIVNGHCETLSFDFKGSQLDSTNSVMQLRSKRKQESFRFPCAIVSRTSSAQLDKSDEAGVKHSTRAVTTLFVCAKSLGRSPNCAHSSLVFEKTKEFRTVWLKFVAAHIPISVAAIFHQNSSDRPVWANPLSHNLTDQSSEHL
jgi:hypothetical protein